MSLKICWYCLTAKEKHKLFNKSWSAILHNYWKYNNEEVTKNSLENSYVISNIVFNLKFYSPLVIFLLRRWLIGNKEYNLKDCFGEGEIGIHWLNFNYVKDDCLILYFCNCYKVYICSIWFTQHNCHKQFTI